jgi:hypothetical protein
MVKRFGACRGPGVNRGIRPWLAGALMLAEFATGCNSQAKLPASCVASGAAGVLRALKDAPGHVALADGTLLSTCVERATGDADLQNVGAVLTDAADRLTRELPASDAAALQLGYLAGAVARGAAQTPGVQAELARRVESAIGFDGGPPARRAAIARGRAAGRRAG